MSIRFYLSFVKAELIRLVLCKSKMTTYCLYFWVFCSSIMLALVLFFNVEMFSNQCLVAFASIVSFHNFMIVVQVFSENTGWKQMMLLYLSMNICSTYHVQEFDACFSTLLSFHFYHVCI